MQRTTIALALSAAFAFVLLAGCVAGVPTSAELCAQQCSCGGCTADAEQSCVKDYDSSRRQAKEAHCEAEYDEYVACLGDQSCGANDDRSCREQYNDYASCGEPYDVGGYW